MPEEQDPVVDDIQGRLIEGKVYITEISTSHSEKIQRVRFEDSSWFTSTRVVFPGGIDLSNVKELNKLTTAAITANSICLSNNRKCMVRDGFKPNIANFVHTAAQNGEVSKLINPNNVIDPNQLTAFIQGNLQKLSQLLCDLGVTAQLEEQANQVNDAGDAEKQAQAQEAQANVQPEATPTSPPPAQQPVPSTPVQQSAAPPVPQPEPTPAPPKRVNPRRKSAQQAASQTPPDGPPVQDNQLPEEVVS